MVTLMDVIKPLSPAISLVTETASPEELERLLMKDRRHKLASLADEVTRDGVSVNIYVACGDPAQEVVKRVLDAEHDLVIKTADGLSLSGKLFGSVARSLLRNCPCPLWILKPQVHGEFDQVLAAIDVDAEDEEHLKLNEQIIDLAGSIARRDDANLHIVSVWDLWMEQALRRRAGNAEIDRAVSKREAKVRAALDQLLQGARSESDKVQVHIRKGNASRNILQIAEEVEADLIVMGTVCRTGVAGFLIGNTAEDLLSDVTCSVLAVKPPGFETPIRANDADKMAELMMMPMV